jgi:mono/diheme cytochrome c family protein
MAHSGLAVTLLSLSMVATLAVSRSAAQKKDAVASGTDIKRGEYLVEQIAECGECHSPRNERGELRRDAWLRGARIWIQPVKPIPNWADRAPALAGLPSFTERQVECVLENGTGPNGEELHPPMHIYHMNHSDAKAIAAYLKSLPQGQSTE